MSPCEFFQRLDSIGDEPESLDFVYDTIDAMLLGGHYLAVDAILAAAEPKALRVTSALSLLTITYGARSKLSARAPLLARLRANLETVSPRNFEAILGGLE